MNKHKPWLWILHDNIPYIIQDVSFLICFSKAWTWIRHLKAISKNKMSSRNNNHHDFDIIGRIASALAKPIQLFQFSPHNHVDYFLLIEFMLARFMADDIRSQLLWSLKLLQTTQMTIQSFFCLHFYYFLTNICSALTNHSNSHREAISPLML